MSGGSSFDENETPNETAENPTDFEEQAIEEIKAMNADLWAEAEKQGIADDVRKAIAEFGEDDVYFGSINAKLYAYRPIYDDEWQDALKKARDAGKPEAQALTDKEMTELCVVAGLNNVCGKRARNGIYPTIAMRIGEVSGWTSDFPAGVNPRAKLPENLGS